MSGILGKIGTTVAKTLSKDAAKSAISKKGISELAEEASTKPSALRELENLPAGAVAKQAPISKTGTLGRQIDEEGLDLDELRKAYKVPSQRKEQPDILKQAAKDLDEGNITKEEFNKLSKEYNPIIPITELPEVPSFKRIEAIIAGNKAIEKGVVGKTINPEDLVGQRVSTRLDIPAYNDYDTWVVTFHEPNAGKVVGYGQTAALKNVKFHLPEEVGKQTKGLKIAQGGAKTPYAAMEGDFVNLSTDKAMALAGRELNNPDSEWIQVGLNPGRHSYFYDKATGDPVLYADELIQVGPLVLARKPVMGNMADFTFKSGGSIERNPYGTNYQRMI